MTLSKFPHGVSSFGVPVLGGSGVPAMFGDYWFVDFTNGDDTYAGKNTDEPFKTLTKAYAECTTSNNDVILINGTGAVELDEMLTWSKNKIHVFGLGAFGATDQSPRIIFSSTGIASDSAAVLKVTGWANTFTNVRINCWGTHANSVTSLWDAGEATTYTNCQFNKFTDLGVATVSDVEARGDSTTWRNCKFGFDTLQQTATRPTLWIKGAGGSARMKNNYFEDCYFVCDTNQATKVFIQVYDTNSLAFTNVWKNPVFISAMINSKSSNNMDNCVDSVSGLNEGQLLFINPSFTTDLFCDSGQAQDAVFIVGPLTHTDAGKSFSPEDS